MVKSIIFDLGGVVIPLTPERAWLRFEQLGIKDVRKQMGLYGQTGIFLKMENGSMNIDTFLSELTAMAQRQSEHPEQPFAPITYEQAAWAWKGYLEDVDLQRLNNILSLRKKYKIFLLSNINPFIVEWAETNVFSGDGHPISHYFDKLYYSCEIMDYKPALSMFQKMIDDAGINPQEALFLDDGPKNIDAARQVGLHTLLVEENQDWMPALTQKLKQLNK